MNEKIQEIAERVRALRDIKGLSVETVAKHIGVDVKTYQEWEGGSADFPVGVLYELAGLFSVDLTELITGQAPRLHTYSVTRSGKGPEVKRRSPYQYWSLAYNFQHRKAEPFLVRIEKESEQRPLELNSHPGQEFDYVLQGRMLISVGGHEVELSEGDSIYFDASEPHGMKALGGSPVSFLAIIL
ncbi:helix-turn-helix domain-containing protein [Gracilinema caldarium]|uniref:helix-turn-helix domain-containing protein n=1 Tax=Gracilinema caldarium TaxID=215591 RepID=UPI0026ED3B8C|nr:cupin domain-containing protein [Gracilinema caldarium]